MCCFLDMSQTSFRGPRGIKIKGKTGKKLSIFIKFIFLFLLTFLNDKCTGGSEKQQINWVWPYWDLHCKQYSYATLVTSKF